MKKRAITSALTALLLLTVLFSCGKRTKPVSTSPQSPITIDCSGFTSNMVIPYLTSEVGQKYAGKVFAKLVAVDKGTGRMEITILPPDGATGFYKDFMDSYNEGDYKLRLIACRENVSSIMGATLIPHRVCSHLGSINFVGKEDISSSDFKENGYTVNERIVHATTDVVLNQSGNLLKPDFIMLTTGIITDNPLGDLMIAFGKSPYYNGCYKK